MSKIIDAVKFQEEIFNRLDIIGRTTLKDIQQCMVIAQLPTCQNCIYSYVPPMLNGKKCYCVQQQKFFPISYYCGKGKFNEVIENE